MANTLKFGNGTWATKEGSALAYNDENGNYKPLPFNFDRASSATRVNKEGLIEVVGRDKPRIDYTDSSEGALLLENSATNLVTYSEDFNWIKTNCTVDSNATLSPDGETNGSRLNFLASGMIRFVTASGDPNGKTFTNSVYLKSDTSNSVIIGILGSGGGLGYITKTVSLTNEWQRFDVSSTFSGSGDNVRFRILSVEEGSIFAYGAQSEENSVASSYIPTNGSSVTRSSETANGSGNSEVFNDSEGVLMLEVSSSAKGENRQLGISDGSSSDRVIITLRPDDETVRFYYEGTTGGSTQIDSASYNFDNTLKIAGKYKSGDIALWVNGFEVGTSTSAITASGLNVLDFYNVANSALAMYSNTKQIQYYDTVLTNEELEYMTSYRSLNELVTELNLNTL